MSTTINLIRDVLDKELYDRDNCQLGRVDGIVIELPEGGQPRMVRLEIGGEILAARVARWLVGPVRWLRTHYGPKREAAVRIEWRHVDRMGRDLHLDIPETRTDALAWEHWLADHIVGKIPFAGSEK
jgi:sporulation protein YlmC with PRC-barrel domain